MKRNTCLGALSLKVSEFFVEDLRVLFPLEEQNSALFCVVSQAKSVHRSHIQRKHVGISCQRFFQERLCFFVFVGEEIDMGEL